MKDFCLFCWLEPFENRWFAFRNNLIECAWRFLLGIKHWLNYGGWHTFITVVTILAYIIAFKWCCEQFSKWWDKL